ncbi:MAG: hypothetical protein IKT60_01855 [Clostridia bacterium]|nr:hypothetical protein [Clostridia bacterium]
MKKLFSRFSNRGPSIFNLKDTFGAARAAMLGASLLSAIISTLTAGVFYTGFLLAYDINIVNAGIIAFIPNISAVLCIFSAKLFGRMRRRRIPLAVMRIFYYTFSILGITVVPVFVEDNTTRVTAFIILTFISHMLNAISSPAYTSWHIRYIPDEVRARYLSVSQIVTNIAACGSALICSLVADALSGSPAEKTVIIVLRYAAFFLAIFETVCLSLPKEYDYGEPPKQKLSNIVTVCLRNKKFALTMLVVLFYYFTIGLTASNHNYYLLNTAKVSYTYISVVNICYLAFLGIFTGYWRKRLSRYAWFTVFWVGTILISVTYLPYAFVNGSNYLWLMTIVRFVQHFIGVGHNITIANLAYVNLPETDRTNYISCYTIIVNAASLLGQLAGTGYVAFMGDASFELLGISLGSVQQLLLITAVLLALTSLFVVRNLRQLSPETDQYKLVPGGAIPRVRKFPKAR